MNKRTPNELHREDPFPHIPFSFDDADWVPPRITLAEILAWIIIGGIVVAYVIVKLQAALHG